MTSDSFEVFYRDSKDRCFRALIVTVGNADEASDLLSESYARALARWDSIESHPSPAAWIVHTALNLHRDGWRRRRRARRQLTLGTATHEDHPDLPVDKRVVAALWGLPKRQREVIALRILLDLDTEECAEVLGVAKGTVTAHLHRGLERLREELSMERTLG